MTTRGTRMIWPGDGARVQRHEIAAWVNPSAWDDQEEAEQVIDEIAALGTDDEGAWLAVVARHDAAK